MPSLPASSAALLLVCLAASFSAAAQPGLITSEFIYETAPFPSCHASTIAQTPSGLVAAWFGGTREGHADVGIWLSRNDGNGWSAPVEVANGIESPEKRYPCWNPVLFRPAAGPLMLFYKVGPSPSKWWGMLMTSADDGRTWGKPSRLPEGILGPIKNKPVQLADGATLCPPAASTPGGACILSARRTWGRRGRRRRRSTMARRLARSSRASCSCPAAG